jgi:hypothetical protein
MKDPARLVREHPSELARAVLRSADADAPPRGALERTLAATGVVIGATTTTTAAAAAKAGMGPLVKAGLVLVGIALMAAVVAYVRRGHDGASDTAAHATATVQPPAPTVPQEPVTPPPAAHDDPAAPTIAATAAPTNAPTIAPTIIATVAPRASSSTATPASSAPSLEEQIAAMDRARAALASGDTAGALRGLDAYDRDFPRGAFSQEATVMRIEALARSGNRARARTLADRFLAANPKSPYARRIHAVLGDAQTNP